MVDNEDYELMFNWIVQINVFAIRNFLQKYFVFIHNAVIFKPARSPHSTVLGRSAL